MGPQFRELIPTSWSWAEEGVRYVAENEMDDDGVEVITIPSLDLQSD
jgi:hypothetical protein